MYCDHIGPAAAGVFRIPHPLAGISRGRRVVLGPAALRFARQTADRKLCTACIKQAVTDVMITLGRKPRVMLVMNSQRRLPPVVAPVITFELIPAKPAATPAPSLWRDVVMFLRTIAQRGLTAFGRLLRARRA
ncbi:MAG: hypothetical protein HYT42_00575 [Candidatus Sungbacteria bacterium]|nr:hypothetical protein [Candidatus Sungbacteria bacterium]